MIIEEYLEKIVSDAMQSLGNGTSQSDLSRRTYRILDRDFIKPEYGKVGIVKNGWLIHITDKHSALSIVRNGFKSSLKDLNFVDSHSSTQTKKGEGLCFGCALSDVYSWTYIIDEFCEWGSADEWAGVIFQANGFNATTYSSRTPVREVIFSSNSPHNFFLLLPLSKNEKTTYLKYGKPDDSGFDYYGKIIDRDGKTVAIGSLYNMFERKGAWNKPKETLSKVEGKLTYELQKNLKRSFDTDKVSKVVDDVVETYFHGTSDLNAGSVHRNGLNNGSPVKTVGGSAEGDFASAKGRAYITSNEGNAVRYATMSRNDGKYGHVFEYEPENEEGFGIDEDELGSYLYDFFNGRVKSIPFRKSLLNVLTANEKKLIKAGNFQGYTSCKKIIDRLTRDEISGLLTQIRSNGRPYFENRTTNANLKHTKHYKFKQPSDEELRNMLNFKKYGNEGMMKNLSDYYRRNRFEVK